MSGERWHDNSAVASVGSDTGKLLLISPRPIVMTMPVRNETIRIFKAVHLLSIVLGYAELFNFDAAFKTLWALLTTHIEHRFD